MCVWCNSYGFWCTVRVSAGSALTYATLPGILPRLKDLLFSGFGPLNHVIAIICFMAGLLPKNHPCFSKEKKDEYGLIKILAACANNIDFNKKNIDKIVVFAMLVCGVVMLWLYLIGLIIYLLTSESHALSMFVTVAPNEDMAFMMLDHVIGIPGLFGSSVSTAAGFPTPFHVALHSLFAFFSYGIFAIAFVIFFYHVVHFVLDVTQTGKVAENMSDETADGEKGFSWLPIRFVVCFGLLLPFGNGLNSAQWITLYTAKFGSGMATNAWLDFNATTGSNPLGEINERLIVKPPTVDNTGLIKGLFLMASCKQIHAWGALGGVPTVVSPYVINGSKNLDVLIDVTTLSLSYNSTPPTIASMNPADHFVKILDFSGGSDIRIVMGEYIAAEPDRYKEYPGKVLPVCGEITIPVTGRTAEALLAADGYLFATLNLLEHIERTGWATATPELDEMIYALFREYRRTSSFVKTLIPTLGFPLDMFCGTGNPSMAASEAILGECKGPVKPLYWNKMMDDYYRYAFRVPAFTAYDFLADTDIAFTDLTVDPSRLYVHGSAAGFTVLGAPDPMAMTTGISKYGWGGAGLWYKKIGEKNGSLFAAANAVPKITKFPMVMEQIKEQRLKTDTKVAGDFCEPFNPQKSGGSSGYSPAEKNQFTAEQATALYAFCAQLFENEAINQDGVTRTTPSTNPIEKAIHMFFSESMLFDKEGNNQVSPMAQLVSIGRILIDKAILGVTVSAASYAIGSAAHISAGDNKTQHALGSLAAVAGGFTMTIALIGLSAGFVLYYMLPLLPFIYFFFAVGRWVKVIFEALVGVPLWALAHMRVGGPGLPGNAAIGGYFLLIEIFIRPIVTVFSLVGAFALFSGLVIGLNSIFLLVSQNLMGSEAPSIGMGAMAIEFSRSMLDQFFLSIFYIAIVYTIGTGCFKLIDILPDNIMRWSGAGVQSMAASDVSDDMIEQWQWELPQRFNSATRTVGETFESTLYGPGKKALGDFKQREAKAAQAAKNSNVDSGGGGP
jgi:hypothetical protein